MDLFDDLPEPSTKTGTAGQPSVASRSNNIPSSKGPTMMTTPSGLSLYDDIPSNSDPSIKPAQGSAGASGTSSLYDNVYAVQESFKKPMKSQTADSEDGTKRKLGSANENDGVKRQKTAAYTISSYLSERKGERDEMQDAHLILEDYSKEFADLHPSIYRLSVYGVFDGHGGLKASRFASENLHKFLQDKFPKGDVDNVTKELKKTFIDTFKKTDEEFLKEATKFKPPWKDGTTAILLLILNDIMFIANIGDSQAVLCRYKEDQKSCVAIPLSTAHNPSLYEERMRIQKAGGHVKDGRVMGVLEVSRSIGDGQYKKLGVTCVPEVRKCQIQDTDRFVIVACDGLWKCFEPQESIKFVNQILEDQSIQGTETKTPHEARYETACARLANEALLRLSADNVTVLLLAINKSTAAS